MCVFEDDLATTAWRHTHLIGEVAGAVGYIEGCIYIAVGYIGGCKGGWEGPVRLYESLSGGLLMVCLVLKVCYTAPRVKKEHPAVGAGINGMAGSRLVCKDVSSVLCYISTRLCQCRQ